MNVAALRAIMEIGTKELGKSFEFEGENWVVLGQGDQFVASTATESWPVWLENYLFIPCLPGEDMYEWQNDLFVRLIKKARERFEPTVVVHANDKEVALFKHLEFREFIYAIGLRGSEQLDALFSEAEIRRECNESEGGTGYVASDGHFNSEVIKYVDGSSRVRNEEPWLGWYRDYLSLH